LSPAKELKKSGKLENIQRYMMSQDNQMEYELEMDKAPITDQQK